ncbi:MAG: hypothetical protein WBG48_09500 [Pricia sp.]
MNKVLLLIIFLGFFLISSEGFSQSEILAPAVDNPRNGSAGGGNSGYCGLICELEKYYAIHMGYGTSSAKGTWSKESDQRKHMSSSGWTDQTRNIYGRSIVSREQYDQMKKNAEKYGGSAMADFNRLKNEIKKGEDKCNCILITAF